MELFSKRPFAFGCFLFLAVSLIACFISVSLLLISGAVLFVSTLLIFSMRRFRKKLFGVGVGFSVVFLSIMHSFLLTDLPMLRARELCGEHMVLCEVIEDGSTSSYSSVAAVVLKNSDGEAVSVKGELICDFSVALSVGDQIYAYATVSEYEEKSTSLFSSRKNNGGTLLTVHVEKENHGVIRRWSEEESNLSMLTDSRGIRMLLNRNKTGLRARLNELLGEEVGGVASGVFVGDTSDISGETMMHFRRSGVVHILSVSGMHLSVLLGFVEILLRKLWVPKKARIAVITACSLLLLILSSFSPSACRSVLMLLIAYFCFMLAEDCDRITALFTAVALIVLFSPYAILDIGLWMSFFATLGLLTVYLVWDRSAARIRSRKGIRRVLAKGSRLFVGGVLMSVAANLLLLPILWIVFGEFSWIGLLCSVSVSFLTTVFLISIPALLLLGWIPFLGEGVAYLVRGVGMLLMWIVEGFSAIPQSVISLRYPFAGVIVALLSITMVTLLLIRLRRKWLLMAAPCAAAIAFALCLVSYSLFFVRNEAVYLHTKPYGEAVALQRGERLAIVDLSYGGWRGAQSALNVYRESYATELELLWISHWHAGHASMLEYLSDCVMIRRLVIPEPSNGEEARIAEQAIEVAKNKGIPIEVYGAGEVTVLWDRLAICMERGVGEAHDALTLSVRGEEQGLLYLSSDALSYVDQEEIGEFETVIVGDHGVRTKEPRTYSLPNGAKTKTIVYASEKQTESLKIKNFEGERLISGKERDTAFLKKTLS